MARIVHDARLESRAARARLAPRAKPYFRALDPGLHLGYRKARAGAGAFLARIYIGEQRYETERLGTADDLSDPNNVDVLDFAQAQEAARKRRDAHHVRDGSILTVSGAIERHLQSLAARGRDPTDTRRRAEAMVLPALGTVPVEELTTDRIVQWALELAKAPPRIRTAKGKQQRHRTVGKDPETLRRRQCTAKRILSILIAALNRAFRDGLVQSDHAWRRVRLFENVAASRARYLTVSEAQRLLNACDHDFRALVHAALLTGCRYSELGRLKVGDFNPDSRTLAILRSKSGRSRHVVLTDDEGAVFFADLCAGRTKDELLLRKADGGAWGFCHQLKPMREASARARLSPPANFHSLRHTYASLSVMNGAPLIVVAKNLGHADTRMVEKHYGHLAEGYVAETVRRTAPRFGLVTPGTVWPMAR